MEAFVDPEDVTCCSRCFGLFRPPTPRPDSDSDSESSTVGFETSMTAAELRAVPVASSPSNPSCPLCRDVLLHMRDGYNDMIETRSCEHHDDNIIHLKWTASYNASSDSMPKAVVEDEDEESQSKVALRGIHVRATITYGDGRTTQKTIIAPEGHRITHGSPKIYYDVTPVVESDDPCATLIYHRPPVPVRSPRAVVAAKNWISTCLQEHGVICDWNGPPSLPTRVLDLQTNVVKLHISQNSERGHYACLSYCWGGDQSTKLRKCNIVEFQNEIRIDSLGQTVQDAIETTRSLGIPYLWIDALCIIQNSDEDKEVQIRKMHEIYKHSVVTIGAASANRHTDGFLNYDAASLDKSRGYYTFELHVPLPSESKVGKVTMHRTYGVLPLVDSIRQNAHDWVDWRHPSFEEPLRTRGWVMQEFFLSSRLLVYGHFEVRWQCRTTDLRKISNTIYKYDLYDRGIDLLNLMDPNYQDCPLEAWTVFVEMFTGRHLSVADDRLNAITGIVEEVAKATLDVCVFGMWKSQILRGGLAWYADEKVTQRSPRAPTWSWASLDCHIMNYAINDEWGTQVRAPCEDFVSPNEECMQLLGKFLPYNAWVRLKASRNAQGCPDLSTEEPEDKAKVGYMLYYFDKFTGSEILIELLCVGGNTCKRLGLVTHRYDLRGLWDRIPFRPVWLI